MLGLWLLVGCNPAPHVASLRAEALDCGRWRLEVEPGGLGGEVQVQVGGQPRALTPEADGRVVVEGRGRPGEEVQVEVRVGADRRTRTISLPELDERPLRLAMADRPLRLAGPPLSLLVESGVTACPREDYRWQLSLEPGAFSRPSGPLPPPYTEERLTTPPLAEGRYTLTLRVEGPFGAVVEQSVDLELVRTLDADGDGVNSARAPGGQDCDDADPAVPGPEAPEPDGRDADCDGRVDEGTAAFDDDRDSFSERQGDCDDADPAVSPLAPEVCGGGDEDCDGRVDEGC